MSLLPGGVMSLLRLLPALVARLRARCGVVGLLSASGRRRAEQDVQRELDLHVELETQQNVAQGMSPEDALRAARAALGSVPLIREDVRAVWCSRWLDALVRSLAHMLRSLRRKPGFSLAAIGVLALGTGGTTAVFTLLDSVMLRPLPVSDPARLYRIGDGDDTVATGRHGRWGVFSFPLYERLKAGAPEFEDLTAFDWGGNLLSVRRQGAEEAGRPVRAQYVSGSYFSTLGVGALSGRLFAADDDRPAAPPVVVLSHRLWQGVYGIGANLFFERGRRILTCACMTRRPARWTRTGMCCCRSCPGTGGSWRGTPGR